MRFATRACSADTAAACCWSSQKPGCASSCSSSASRVLSRSGSKVTTDPVQLGPDPFELLLKREFLVGHGGGGWYRRRLWAGRARSRCQTPLEDAVVDERRVLRLAHAQVLQVQRAREALEQALAAAEDYRRGDDGQLIDQTRRKCLPDDVRATHDIDVLRSRCLDGPPDGLLHPGDEREGP